MLKTPPRFIKRCVLIAPLILLSNHLWAKDLARNFSPGPLIFWQRLQRNSAHLQYWRKLIYDDLKKNKDRAFYHFSVDAGPFYLSSANNRSDESEFVASFDAFRDVLAQKVGPYMRAHPQCFYPERVHFFKKVLGLPLPEVHCPDFEEWFGLLRKTEAVSLLFSSAYPGNPASMFGHTFLVLKKKRGRRAALTDYAISFSANVNGRDPGFLYALKGLFGGYIGTFDMRPYYQLIQEYVVGEHRDLYEYELNLSQPQRESLIRHFWELYQLTGFSYFFLDENCSYFLARFLELPENHHRLSLLTRWYYAPKELVVRSFREQGYVSQRFFRPSQFKLFEYDFKRAPPLERRLHTENELKKLSDSGLQLQVSYLHLLKTQKKSSFKREKLYLQSLKALSKRDLKKEGPRTLSEENAPEKGHGIFQGAVGMSFAYRQEWTTWRFKQSYHDLLDPPAGYERFSQFDFMNVSLWRSRSKGRWQLRHLHLFDIYSVDTYYRMLPKYSWRLKTSLEQNRFFQDRRDWNNEALFGVSHQGLSALGGFYLRFSGYLRKKIDVAPKVQLSWNWFYKRLSSLYLLSYRYDLLSRKEGELTVRLSHGIQLGKSFFLRGVWENHPQKTMLEFGFWH